MRRLPRLVLAAPHSGAGKTTVALALLQALGERGLKVQPFKVGPDYADPSHLEAASGRRVYNLDGFFLDEEGLLSLFQHGARGADLALRDSPLAKEGEAFKGHEFHYARMEPSPSPAWRRVGGEEVEGYTDGRILGSFIHLYLPARPQGARRLFAWTGGIAEP